MSVATPSTILIVIATDRVSGPLKGIFQAVRYLDHARHRPLLALLRAREAGVSEAEEEAEQRRIPNLRLTQSRTFDWTLFRRTRQVALEHRVALVQTHGYKPHVLGFFLKRSLGLPWVGFEHGWTAENWRIRLYHRADWLLRFADQVVAVSRHTAVRLQRLGVPGTKILTIHNAVEYDETGVGPDVGSFRRAHGLPPDAPMVAVIGRMSKEKGHRLFIDAVKRVRAIAPDVSAVVVGEGVDEAAVHGYATRLGLDGSVHFVGYHRPISAVYADVDLVVIPSESEGSPNVLLEAMSAGRPVIATSVGGIPEIVTHERHALLVPPGDAGALASAIERLLRDKPLRDRLVEEARLLVQANHSPARRAGRITQIYESLLA